jgi:hypothetical protein
MHVIRKNKKTGERNPVITCKTSRSNTYGHTVSIEGPSKVIYSPDKPLSCGARVWIETEAPVTVDDKCIW